MGWRKESSGKKRKRIQPPLGELSAEAINQKSEKCVLNEKKSSIENEVFMITKRGGKGVVFSHSVHSQPITPEIMIHKHVAASIFWQLLALIVI